MIYTIDMFFFSGRDFANAHRTRSYRNHGWYGQGMDVVVQCFQAHKNPLVAGWIREVGGLQALQESVVAACSFNCVNLRQTG